MKKLIKIIKILAIFLIIFIGHAAVVSASIDVATGTTTVTVGQIGTDNASCGTTHYDCSVGNSTNNGGDANNYTWTCSGINGGTDAQCSESKNNGKCDAGFYGCLVGTSTNNVNGATAWTWTCTGSNGGTDAQCSDSKDDAQCGATHYLCDAGTPASTAETASSYTWMCNGSNGGYDDSCTESKPSPDLIAGAVIPTTAAVGIPTTFSVNITNQGPVDTSTGFSNFFQVADGPGGTGTVTDLAFTSMSALAAGSTAASTKTFTFATAGTHSMRACADKKSSGDAGVITESDENNNCGAPWTDITVSAAPSINGICSSSHYNCSVGTYPGGGTGGSTGPWSWSCVGSGGGSTATCNEAAPVNGLCASTTYTCSAGTVTNTQDGPPLWNWSCAGSNGGSTASCQRSVGPTGGSGTCGDTLDNNNDKRPDTADPTCHTDCNATKPSTFDGNLNEGAKKCLKPVYIER